MKAYHGKQETKDFYIARVKKHRELDNLIQGQGWSDGRGCAIGCTLENYDHAQYEKELGVPEWLARVEDTIFEGLPKDKTLLWPERFMTAIRVGADLEKTKTPFLIFILEENLKTLDSLPDMSEFLDVKDAINLSREATKEMIRCHREGLDLSAAARSARSAAESARSARSAAESAWAARSAAWSESARSAAESARSAAESARSAAWSARSARSAAWAAGSAVYEKFADKLIELLEGCIEEEK